VIARGLGVLGSKVLLEIKDSLPPPVVSGHSDTVKQFSKLHGVLKWLPGISNPIRKFGFGHGISLAMRSSRTS